MICRRLCSPGFAASRIGLPSLYPASLRRHLSYLPTSITSGTVTVVAVTRTADLSSTFSTTFPLRAIASTRRLFSNTPLPPQNDDPSPMSPAESAIADLLIAKLSPTSILVQDVSGGCGSMYAIEITSHAFRGQSLLKQQRMVNDALGDVVKSWHGLQIRTSVPSEVT